MSEENNNNNNNDNDDKINEEQENFESKQLQEIFEQRDKLVELIKNYSGNQNDATFQCCLDLIIFGCQSHFEALGLITELEHAYRDASIEVLREQEEDLCEECGEHHGYETSEDEDEKDKKHLLN